MKKVYHFAKGKGQKHMNMQGQGRFYKAPQKEKEK